MQAGYSHVPVYSVNIDIDILKRLYIYTHNFIYNIIKKKKKKNKAKIQHTPYYPTA